MKNFFFTITLIVISSLSFAQQGLEHNYYAFQYRYLDDSSNYKKIFRLLSVNNEKNINSLKLELFFKRTETVSDNNLDISYSSPQINGSTYFRDFALDSLLLPDLIKIYVTPKTSNGFSAETKVFTFNFPGVIRIKNFDKYKDYNFRIEFDISGSKLKRFIETAGKINQYYSYHTLLGKLKKNFFENSESGIVVLRDYDIVHRIIYNIDNLNIVNELYLKEHDPLNFMALYNKVKRLERRKHTLSFQYINKDLSTKPDKEAFVNNLVSISTTFLREMTNYQPYLASSFEQTAIVINDEVANNFYNTVCKKLDNNVPENVPVAMEIFHYFLKGSEQYNEDEMFSSSLVMLKNAIVWNEITNISDTGDLKPYVNRAIDGMLSSFVSIAEAASKNGNEKMAEMYLEKTGKYYLKNIKEFPFADDSEFSGFQQHLLNIAEVKLKKKNYQDALNVLTMFKGMTYNDTQKIRKEEIINKVYNGIFEQYFKMVSISFNAGRIDEAYYRLMDLHNFQKVNKDYITINESYEKRINKIAYGLILEYLQRGEMLWDKNNFKDAMKNYGIAEKIQNNFLDYKIERLSVLLNQTAIPVVINIIDKAELQIWANNIDSANILFEEASETVNKYNLFEVDTIDVRLSELKYKLETRKCVQATNGVKNNVMVINNRINSGKWQEAYERFVNTEKIIDNNKGCNIDTSGFAELKNKFSNIFNYIKRLKNVETILLTQGYDKVWRSFADIDYEYYSKGFDKSGIPAPELYKLLKVQKNPANIKQIISYYLSKGYTNSAIKYLNLLNEMNISDKETKVLLSETGAQMAKKESYVETFKEISIKDSRWYKPLINSYLQMIN